MAKWKGYKVEWLNSLECRFKHEGSYSAWFKPLRWPNGDLGRFEFLKELKAFASSKEPLGTRMPTNLFYFTLTPTTRGVTVYRDNPQQGGFISRSEDFNIVTARSVEIKFES